MTNYEYNKGFKVPVKSWTKGVEFPENAKEQLLNLTKMNFIHKHVAVMPDVHLGKGCSIGTVLPTKGALIPAAAGVDLGCGMMAIQLSLKADQLPDNLNSIRLAVEQAIPHGRTNNGKVTDSGGWMNNPPKAVQMAWKSLETEYKIITDKHPKAKAFNTFNHLGSLGTGNHFWELCLDENDSVWVMLHSGSRGLGNRIGMYFIEKAKEEMERYHITEHLPDKDMAYLVEHTEVFDDYVEAVSFAQKYASANREIMMDNSLKVLSEFLPTFTLLNKAINCHHNYTEIENHFGENVYVTRKGAVRARKGDLGIIPGNMKVGSYIVKGLGNEESFCSCSHGAGRVMSRTQAKKNITMNQHIKEMEGIECRLDESLLDESPSAYKDLNSVMSAQSDLIAIMHQLKPVINVKG